MSLIVTSRESKPFDWQRWPETEAFVEEHSNVALEANPFARNLADRMLVETSTRFNDWLDHLVLGDRPGLGSRLEELGYRRGMRTYGVNTPVYEHHGGLFPAIVVRSGAGPAVIEAAIVVESIAAFSSSHDLGLVIEGQPLGPYRIARIEGSPVSLAVVERRGYRGFEPFSGEMARIGRMAPQVARDAIAARETWQTRRRRFDDDAEGFAVAAATLERVIELAGSVDLACHLVFEVERDYWMSRNRAARVQKERQDRLGLGWANHDHHTFRSSRKNFPKLIELFRRLGFHLRERFHAGEHAGWGAQVLEHATTGIVVFADLDLLPEEISHDFTREALDDLPRPNTVGLWVGLHGESMLEAGMHHLEAQFDFDALAAGLEEEASIQTMKPFSDFPFLRQAFTVGERWRVAPFRADRLFREGKISAEQHEKFLAEGAIGSHLENLQRREGFKGFNQQAVSAIIADTDPRLH
ncbi:MAG: hypothetical protein SFX72_12020 [Isosphaeraceae bacterium]|nr:hypothetical protein [Isosphaeraceae bacterium]